MEAIFKNISRKLNKIWQELNNLPDAFEKLNDSVVETGAQQEDKLDKLIDITKKKEYTVESEVHFDTKALEKLIEDRLPDTLRVEITNKDAPLESITIDNLPKVQDVAISKYQVEEITKAINNIDTKPEVIVEQNEVTVEKQVSTDPTEYMPVQLTDGKKFVNINKRFDDVVTAIKQQGAGVVVSNSAGEEDPLSVYKPSDTDKNVGSNSYYGSITASGSWVIQRVNSDSTEIRYARGTTDYTTNWTNRASLSYNYFDVIF